MVTSWNTGNSYEATITSIGNSPVESMKSSENPNMSYYPFTAVVEKMQIFHLVRVSVFP